MKESISAVNLFQIVILFILLFTGIMCLTINNSNAFGVKDEIINIIELSDGNFLEYGKNGEVLSEEIVRTIAESNYRTTGVCDTDAGYVGFDRNGQQSQRASICIKCTPVTEQLDNYMRDLLGEKVVTGDALEGYYYQVVVFYQLDIPVIKQIYNFETKGETKIIYGQRSALCES